MKATITLAVCALAMAATAYAQELPEQMAWIPLSPEEIADARPCNAKLVLGTGYLNELAICAGEKKIGTGTLFSNNRNGISLDGEILWKMPPLVPAEAFTATAWTTVRQAAPYPEWHFDYYVLSGQQLDAIIERARRDPDWKGPATR